MGLMPSMPGASTLQRAREYTIRDAMSLSQRFTMPEGVSAKVIFVGIWRGLETL